MSAQSSWQYSFSFSRWGSCPDNPQRFSRMQGDCSTDGFMGASPKVIFFTTYWVLGWGIGIYVVVLYCGPERLHQNGA